MRSAIIMGAYFIVLAIYKTSAVRLPALDNSVIAIFFTLSLIWDLVESWRK
uniref:Uncharacterized protein n=1 Tax=viral metagenome TaxID=1070528 RepID=A0A6M3LQL2_9ZZZZ